jgi:hypothetical protein
MPIFTYARYGGCTDIAARDIAAVAFGDGLDDCLTVIYAAGDCDVFLPFNVVSEIAAAETDAARGPDAEFATEFLTHDCPRDAFLGDPITRSYGCGPELLPLIACEVCDSHGCI